MIFFYGEVSNQMISTFTFCFNNVERILSNERRTFQFDIIIWFHSIWAFTLSYYFKSTFLFYLAFYCLMIQQRQNPAKHFDISGWNFPPPPPKKKFVCCGKVCTGKTPGSQGRELPSCSWLWLQQRASWQRQQQSRGTLSYAETRGRTPDVTCSMLYSHK